MDTVAPIAVGGVVLPVYVTEPVKMDQVGTQNFDHILQLCCIIRYSIYFKISTLN